MRFLTLLFLLALLACKNTYKLSGASPLGEDWTLELVPNTLDNVGTVFAVKGRHQTFIYSVDLKTKGGPAAIPNHKLNRSVSAGAFFNFLQVKGLDSASLDIGDSTHLSTSFDVSNAYYMRQNGNILTAFNDPVTKKTIADNLTAFGLKETDKVYMVTEILKSPSVSIKVDKYSNPHLNIGLIVSKILSANPRIGVTQYDSTNLVYNFKDSLVIFYKLNPINFNITRGRGPGAHDSVSSVILSDKQVKISELYH